MARRGHGEGSIYQRGDGRWTASISLEGGKRKTFYGKTRKAVQEQLKTALHQQQQSIRSRTYERYEEIVRLHLVPGIGPSPTSEALPSASPVILREETGGRAFYNNRDQLPQCAAQSTADRRSLEPHFAKRVRSRLPFARLANHAKGGDEQAQRAPARLIPTFAVSFAVNVENRGIESLHRHFIFFTSLTPNLDTITLTHNAALLSGHCLLTFRVLLISLNLYELFDPKLLLIAYICYS